jgi:hypothetical protein
MDLMMKRIKLSGGALNFSKPESTDCPLPNCAFQHWFIYVHLLFPTCQRSRPFFDRKKRISSKPLILYSTLNKNDRFEVLK